MVNFPEGPLSDADSMLAAARFYTGTNSSLRGIVMSISYHFETGPLWRAQVWAFGQLAWFGIGDLRWAMVALISRGVAAAVESLFLHIAGRAWQGARFAGRLTPAATTVAAGSR
jgi:hypothetical protein